MYFQLLGLNEDDFLSKLLVYKWLWQCLSIVRNSIENPFGADGILVLNGKQGIGKTSFFRKLAMKAILTDENINLIVKKVMKLCERENENANLKRLSNLLKENENATYNLIKALELGQAMEIITSRIQEKGREKEEIEKQIALERKGQVNISETDVRFFFNKLKKGNLNDLRYRKTLINVLVAAVYLYDDRVTIIFTVGDKSVTVNTELLNDIEKNDEAFKSSYLSNVVPPLRLKSELYIKVRFFFEIYAVYFYCAHKFHSVCFRKIIFNNIMF